jgi:hypothetical protein
MLSENTKLDLRIRWERLQKSMKCYARKYRRAYMGMFTL